MTEIVFFSNNSFRQCTFQVNNIFKDSAEHLDIVISMHNFLEHSDNYSMTSQSFWDYYRDEIDDDANENNADDYRLKNARKQQVNILSTKQK